MVQFSGILDGHFLFLKGLWLKNSGLQFRDIDPWIVWSSFLLVTFFFYLLFGLQKKSICIWILSQKLVSWYSMVFTRFSCLKTAVGHIWQSFCLIASNAAAVLPAFWALRQKVMLLRYFWIRLKQLRTSNNKE